MRTKYARSGDISIAYQIIGDGVRDLVVVPGYVSHLEYAWEEPGFAHYLRRLARFARVIMFDKRGTGLSDRVGGAPSLEERMDDVRAVMDAAGSQRAAILGGSEGGPLAILFAATYPARISALILYGTFATFHRAADYPWRPTAEELAERLREREQTIHETWGNINEIDVMAPSKMDDPDFRRWYGAYLRLAASPGAALSLARMNYEIDIRDILPTVRVPTLVLHRTGDRSQRIEEGRYVASRIPQARFVALPGDDHMPWVGDSDAIADEIEGFVTGVRSATVPDGVLVTVLAGEFVPPATRAVEGAAEVAMRHEVHAYRGKLVALDNSRFLAHFDGPVRAVRCAEAIVRIGQDAGLPVGIGLDTAECSIDGDSISGAGVDLACRLARRAAPSQVLVSSTVKVLVSGAGLRFGVAPGSGAQEVFELTSADSPAPLGAAQPVLPANRTNRLPRHQRLTPRQREVLSLVARGMSNREIADALSIGERTVESHVAGILAKLQLANRIQLMAWLAAPNALTDF